MDKSYSLLEIHNVICVNSNIDSRLFQTKPLPLLGKDLKLLQMIFWQSHLIFVSGLKGQTYHRSKILTAGHVRNSNYGVVHSKLTKNGQLHSQKLLYLYEARKGNHPF